MTNEQQSLGIIPRGVCGDLLQRLLGSAAGNIHTTSSTTTAPDDRTQECAIASGIIVKQEPETRSVNGLVQNGDIDSEDDDDLSPLGGEDSNENTSSKYFWEPFPKGKFLSAGDDRKCCS